MAKTGGFSTMLDAATRRAFNFLRGEVDTLDERVTIIESGGGGDFPEAPLDGQQYGRQSGAWTVVDSSGSVWHVGSGAPAVGLGANGDFYLDEATGDVYEKSSGVWSLVANILGPQGEQGDQGIQGEQGEQGVPGDPGDPGADGLGWTGGSYDDSDGTVTFTSDDGLGFSTGDLRGSDGDPGAPGTPGVDGLGWTGGSYDDATGIVEFTSDDGLGFSTDDLRGAPGDPGSPGDPGAPGADGKGWTGGTYDPATGTVTFTSDDGLEFTTGDLRGADGLHGLDGATWHVGSGDPDPALGEVNDYYLDGDAGWVWIKRSSGWTNLYVNLTGPPGPGIEDAPSDGDQYARQDGAWTVVSGGGGLTWPLLAPDGTVTAPSYSFAADADTGLYLATAGDVRLAVGGSDVIGFDDRYITLGGQQQGVGRMSILVGGAGTPVYGFEGDVGTGMYRAAAASLGFSTGGAERVTIGSDVTHVSTKLQVDGQILAPSGAGFYAGAPGHSFVDHPTTGMLATDDGDLRLAVGEAFKVWIKPDSTVVTTDFTVEGVTTTTGLDAKANGTASATNPNITFGTSSVNAQTGFFRNSTGAVQVACEGEQVWRFTKSTAIAYNDLQVDGNLTLKKGGDAANPAIAFADIDGMGIYTHAGNNWLRFAVAGAQRLNIREDAVVVSDNLTVNGTINGTLAFGIAEGIDTADVLDRAEVATMPAVDDEGVATTDAEVESVTVNEVVTALLAKVKEQTTEIATLTATVESLTARIETLENQ